MALPAVMQRYLPAWIGALLLSGAFAYVSLVWAAGDIPTKFTNRISIYNTRHNMTMRSPDGVALLNTSKMEDARNDYGEICVYCHTPHGADASAAVPLWNRSIPTTTYITYDKLNTSTLTQTVTQPGAASLACLSCHDGQQAIDATRNMPGSGRFKANPDNTFLDTWPTGSWYLTAHLTLSRGTPGFYTACLSCHNPDGLSGGGYPYGAGDFTLAYISTDLRDDHPVGVRFPALNGDGADFKTPTGSRATSLGTMLFFDDSPVNARMDKTEIRLYDTGDGPKVECASCHDPHGVPSAGPSSQFFPTFLRKANASSALCMTCHAK